MVKYFVRIDELVVALLHRQIDIDPHRYAALLRCSLIACLHNARSATSDHYITSVR